MKKTLYLIPVLAVLLFPAFANAEASFPDGCNATTKFSATTGQPCQKPACSPGDLYNSMTGQKCNDESSTLPEGCTTTAGFSPLTGKKCDGSSRSWSNPWGTPTVQSTPVVQQQPTISQPVSVVDEDKSKIVSTMTTQNDLYLINACFYDYSGNSAVISTNDNVYVDLNNELSSDIVKPISINENCANFTVQKSLRPEGNWFRIGLQKTGNNTISLSIVRSFSVIRNTLIMH